MRTNPQASLNILSTIADPNFEYLYASIRWHIFEFRKKILADPGLADTEYNCEDLVDGVLVDCRGLFDEDLAAFAVTYTNAANQKFSTGPFIVQANVEDTHIGIVLFKYSIIRNPDYIH